MSLEIGAVMRKLKNICVDNNLKGFLIAHMQKSRYIDKKDPEPGLEDIRDSSFIAQESDNVFIIWRRKNKDNGAYLKVDKNRRLGIMGRKIPLIKVNNFLEVDIGQDKKV
jgi:replicative DNA helicase